MIIGASLGLWGRSKVVRTVERYIPSKVVKAAKRTARTFAKEIVAAGKESKAAMRAREDELRS